MREVQANCVSRRPLHKAEMVFSTENCPSDFITLLFFSDVWEPGAGVSVTTTVLTHYGQSNDISYLM